MNKLVVMAVDDEPLALRGLEIELAAFDDVELRAALTDPRSAVAAAERERPDVFFLDISMPRLNGLELARKIRNFCPYLILLTAHSDMAVAAFDAGVEDYLTKPINPERLRLALDRAHAYLAVQSAASEFEHLADMALRFERARATAPGLPAQQIRFSDGKQEFSLRSDEIEEVRAERDYIRVVGSGRGRLASMTMKQTAELLPKGLFERVHRSSFVNRAFVTGLKREGRERLTLTLRSGREVPVGRGYRAHVQQVFSHLRADEGDARPAPG